MKINEGFIKRKVGDSYIIESTASQDEENKNVLEIDEISSEIFDYIEQGLTMPDIARKLADEYGRSMVKALYDVSRVIEKFKRAGIISK